MLDTYDYKHTLKYVILIVFPQQQWLQERASVLRLTYIACFFTSDGVNLIRALGRGIAYRLSQSLCLLKRT